MLSLFLRIVMIVLALATAPTWAMDDKSKSGSAVIEVLADPDIDRSVRFVMNNLLFTAYHEVAHLLLFQQEWPVLGSTEDVADNFATYMLLKQGYRVTHDALRDAALGWKLESEELGGNFAISDFYDEHRLDIQRSYQMVCLMVGQSRETFYTIAQEWGIDRRRQITCAHDYFFVSRTLDRLLTPQLEESERAKVTIEYEVAGDGVLRSFGILRDSKILESVAQDIRDNFDLTEDVKLTASTCGATGSFYDAPTNQITVCYELLNEYYERIQRHLAASDEDL